ncbi:MAG: SDR family oxidoreductase [Gordonia sp. (in: high G+C Gram-positive bacteria)]
MARTVIIGGHGKVALRLASLLADRGDEVDAVIRNPAHADDVRAAGATPVVADVESADVDALAALIRGHDAVVWSAGAGGGNPARTYAVDRDAAIRSMDAAAAASVSRYIMVSYFGSGPNHGVPQDNSFFSYADAKASADAYLQRTGLDWTILGPSRLTTEPGTGRIEVGTDGATAKGQVSRDNVAQVIAAVLGDESTVRRVIEFNDGDTPIAQAL